MRRTGVYRFAMVVMGCLLALAARHGNYGVVLFWAAAMLVLAWSTEIPSLGDKGMNREIRERMGEESIRVLSDAGFVWTPSVQRIPGVFLHRESGAMIGYEEARDTKDAGDIPALMKLIAARRPN